MIRIVAPNLPASSVCSLLTPALSWQRSGHTGYTAVSIRRRKDAAGRSCCRLIEGLVVGRKRPGHPWRLSDEQRDEIDRRIAAGATQEEVAEVVGCDLRTVIRWITRTGGGAQI